TKLTPEMLEIVKKRFEKPTLSQEAGIPPILAGKNVLLMAPTGTGKTETVLIPIFDRWSRERPKPISILYITPLKALNRDLHERILWWSRQLDFSVSVRHGDTSQRERKLQLEHPDDLLVVTCEQLEAMLVGERMRELLKNVRYVVVDEVHELVDSKRGVQLSVALERLRELCGDFQLVALSATVGSPKDVANFIFAGRPHELIEAQGQKQLSVLVESPFPNAEDRLLAEKLFIGDSIAARLRTIYDLMKSHTAVLTFTNTREAAETLSSRLHTLDRNFPHEVHHSSLSKEMRVKTEQEFKEQKIRSIICTSSLQLGIDIGAIDLVIQYLSPREVTQFVQRLGRAGHSVTKMSKGVIIAGDGDDIFESAVIARKALDGELEHPRIHSNSLDVIAHQIIGLAMSNYQIPPRAAYDIVRRATPYRDLSWGQFELVLRFLESIHLLWADKDKITRKRRAFEYYFGTMSTIPDNKTYRIIDTTTNTPVGSLDEAFVAEHSESGSSFIVRGRPWRVVSVENGKVFAEPLGDLTSAVPAWEGELIPVPYSVAQEVGNLRKMIADLLKKGKTNAEISACIKLRYPVSSQTAAHMIALIKRQTDYPMPDDKSVIFEHFGEYTVMHACFGSLVNETLARFISAMLTAEQGRAIACKTDPYRIIFRDVLPSDIKAIIEKYRSADIEPALTAALSNSSLFKHRFIQVAKRFGAIAKGADFSKINVERIIKAYESTPVTDETLREIFTEKLDVEQAVKVFDQLRNRHIKLVDGPKISPLGELGLKYELHDIAMPDRPEAEILKVFGRRLLNTKLRLVCVNCGKYDMVLPVNDIPDEPRCSKCASKLLAAVSPFATETKAIVQKRLKGADLNGEELKKLMRIRHSADVMIVYGRRGAMALAGRGVGPQTAARILAKMPKSDEELCKAILKAEKEFLRTHKFWAE
ncbi:MAG: DEAD/DEAH box helicase, partial [Candidatus Aenigmatarchaeota archaeon]